MLLTRLALLIYLVGFSFMERCTISVLMLMQYNPVEDVQGFKLQGIFSQLKREGYNNESNIEFAALIYSQPQN